MTRPYCFSPYSLNLTPYSGAAPACPRCCRLPPPFGRLYGLPVYVAASLTEEREIAFNAGTYTEIIKMDYQDFDEL